MPPLLRSTLAVLTGFVIVVVLLFGTDYVLHSLAPQAFDPAGNTHEGSMLLVVVGYIIIFVTLGSFITACLAPDRPMRHALILGGMCLLLTLIPTIKFWQVTPVWYHLVVLASVLPAAWLGGHFRERQLSPA